MSVEILTPHNKKIRGITKLTLDNGVERKVVESENTFYPNSIADNINSLGMINQMTDMNSDSWSTFCGGILLFNTAIPANSKYMPAGTKMVGNASYGIINSSQPKELGSWDSYSTTSNSLELNYSWSPAQGNGIINSVCLTSAQGGLIGYGNPSGEVYNTNSLPYLGHNNNYTSVGTGYVYKDYIYTTYNDDTTKKFTVKRVPIQTSKINIFTLEESYGTEHTYVNNVGANNIGFYGSNGKIFVMAIQLYNWNDGEQCHAPLLVYDIENDTLDEYMITNNTGYTLGASGGGSGRENIFVRGAIPEENVIFVTKKTVNDPCFVGINYTTGNLVYSFDHLASVWAAPKYITPDLFAYGVSSTDSNTYMTVKVWDKVNSTEYPQNVKLPYYTEYQSSDGYFAPYCFDINGMRTFSNPLHLVTINNLNTTVTKTDTDMLMVKYTLVAE